MTAARTAYDSLEPFHVVAYFNPGIGAALADTGLDPHAFYLGGRGAPLGDAAAEVVASTFYNFSPALVSTGWAAARDVGLEKVAERRYLMLDEVLRHILGDDADNPEIAELADGFGRLAEGLPLGGRALAAAWSATTPPDGNNLLSLWNNIAILREWRGDNHIAVLVLHGLDGIDACTFHEATLPDPTIRRRVMGRRMTQLTRGWSDEQWEASIDSLVERGIAERTDDGHRLTSDGAALYDDIEATTDALGETVWAGAGDLIARMRPYVKAVIDAGILPGTTKR
ncbi:hypothetical protein nbrc107696_46110 [Gordonia spumicola]|uniref:SalK n=1 Tax=Gordonia spumicola TaxID=589161 RepID=A0A7I9VFQ3_9ACTN|nr:transglutaminase-like family protein [Gordonia spumicola]GEE00236.1 hypothetical protein nbrc107696_06820 [Gordonia spumicola]GEE04165.1 hypothetical protein nbrc107696_46110 [Gordonia spumicola]